MHWGDGAWRNVAQRDVAQGWCGAARGEMLRGGGGALEIFYSLRGVI